MVNHLALDIRQALARLIQRSLVKERDGFEKGLLRRYTKGLYHRSLVLFHRHAFGQVAGLVHVGALDLGGMVGQQLHRHAVVNSRHNTVYIFYRSRMDMDCFDQS